MMVVKPDPRPFYAIGHNTNTLQEVKNALAAGANAIEPDVNLFEEISRGVCISHLTGGSDAMSLEQFLLGLHDIAQADERLCLIIFDCKGNVATAAYGVILLSAIRRLLTFDTNMHIIISVSELEHAVIFDGIKEDLQLREGLMIDENKDPEMISEYFRNAGVEQACYGNGISVPPMVITGPNVMPSMERACALRASTNHPKFICVWTVNDETQKEEFLRVGVDGIICDDLEELSRCLAMPEFRETIRLANRKDNPFDPPNSAYSLAVYTGDHAMAGTNACIRFRLNGSRESAEVIFHAELHHRMMRNQCTYVTLQSCDLGDLISVTVELGDEGIAPDWFLEKMIVESAVFGVSETVLIQREILRNTALTASFRHEHP